MFDRRIDLNPGWDRVRLILGKFLSEASRVMRITQNTPRRFEVKPIIWGTFESRGTQNPEILSNGYLILHEIGHFLPGYLIPHGGLTCVPRLWMALGCMKGRGEIYGFCPDSRGDFTKKTRAFVSDVNQWKTNCQSRGFWYISENLLLSITRFVQIASSDVENPRDSVRYPTR
jgi:hypothetical protein